MNYWSAQQQKQ